MNLSVPDFLAVVRVVMADEIRRVHLSVSIAWEARTWGTVVFSWCVLGSISNRGGWSPRAVVIATNAVFAESLGCGTREGQSRLGDFLLPSAWWAFWRRVPGGVNMYLGVHWVLCDCGTSVLVFGHWECVLPRESILGLDESCEVAGFFPLAHAFDVLYVREAFSGVTVGILWRRRM